MLQRKIAIRSKTIGALRPVRLLRSAVVATGVVVFLFVFRPFGLAIDSAADALVLFGIAPLNFFIMLGIHILAPRSSPIRSIIALTCLVVGNTAYLMIWSFREWNPGIALSVTMVVTLTASFVFLWLRGNIPQQELDGSNLRGVNDRRPIVLSGDSDKEFLQLASNELLFMTASGNYVEVHYRKGGEIAKSLLRSSLANLAAQVPDDLLVQCHRSHFVNLAAARRIVHAKGRTLIEYDGGRRVPVSRMFRQDVVAAISS